MSNEDKIIQKLNDLDQKLDRVIVGFVNHDEKMTTFVTKNDLGILENKVMTALDQQLVILQRLD